MSSTGKLSDRVYAAAAVAISAGTRATEEFRDMMRECASQAKDLDLRLELESLAAWMDKVLAEGP